MKVILRALTIALVSAVLLGGCAGYSKNYRLYVQGCQDPGNQKSLEVPVPGASQPLRVNDGCTLTAPTDPTGVLVQAGTTLAVGFLNAGVQYYGIQQNNKTTQVQSQYNADILKAAFGAAGQQFSAGGNINFTGNDGSAGNDTTTNPPPASTGSSGGSGGTTDPAPAQ